MMVKEMGETVKNRARCCYYHVALNMIRSFDFDGCGTRYEDNLSVRCLIFDLKVFRGQGFH